MLHSSSLGEPAGRPGIESRVLRGGSWHGDLVIARADCRSLSHPDYRYSNFGFRVVVVSSPIGDAGRGAADR